MGYFFEFDEVNNITRCCWEGPITDDILLEGYAAAERLLASRPPCRSICDHSAVTRFDVGDEIIKRLANTPPDIRPEWVQVIVAPKDVVYGLARMFEILSDQSRPNLHVVRTLKEANALLGVTSPQFSRVNAA